MKNLYVKMLKFKRKLALSSSQEEYANNYIKYVTIIKCLSSYKVENYKGVSFKNAFYDMDTKYESADMYALMHLLEHKYTKTMPEDKMKKMDNIDPNKEECMVVLND